MPIESLFKQSETKAEERRQCQARWKDNTELSPFISSDSPRSKFYRKTKAEAISKIRSLGGIPSRDRIVSNGVPCVEEIIRVIVDTAYDKTQSELVDLVSEGLLSKPVLDCLKSYDDKSCKYWIVARIGDAAMQDKEEAVAQSFAQHPVEYAIRVYEEKHMRWLPQKKQFMANRKKKENEPSYFPEQDWERFGRTLDMWVDEIALQQVVGSIIGRQIDELSDAEAMATLAEMYRLYQGMEGVDFLAGEAFDRNRNELNFRARTFSRSSVHGLLRTYSGKHWKPNDRCAGVGRYVHNKFFEESIKAISSTITYTGEPAIDEVVNALEVCQNTDLAINVAHEIWVTAMNTKDAELVREAAVLLAQNPECVRHLKDHNQGVDMYTPLDVSRKYTAIALQRMRN